MIFCDGFGVADGGSGVCVGCWSDVSEGWDMESVVGMAVEVEGADWVSDVFGGLGGCWVLRFVGADWVSGMTDG